MKFFYKNIDLNKLNINNVHELMLEIFMNRNNNSDNIGKAQHTHQKAMLKNFGEKLYLFNKKGTLVSKNSTAINNISIKNNFYNIAFPNEKDIKIVDDYLNVLEQLTPKLFSQIINNCKKIQTETITKEECITILERDIIINYIYESFYRSTKYREFLEKSVNKNIDIYKKTYQTEYLFFGEKNFVQKFLLPHLQGSKILNLYGDKDDRVQYLRDFYNFIFYYNTTSIPFITSDSPILLIKNNISSNVEIFYPLSNNVCMFGYDNRDKNNSARIQTNIPNKYEFGEINDEETIRDLNKRQLLGCHLFVYSNINKIYI